MSDTPKGIERIAATVRGQYALLLLLDGYPYVELTAQQIGGAITYIRRQSIQTACGISVDLDDDGAVASGFRATAPATASTYQQATMPHVTPRPLTK